MNMQIVKLPSNANQRRPAFETLRDIEERLLRDDARLLAEADLLDFWIPAIRRAMRRGKKSTGNLHQRSRTINTYYQTALEGILGPSFTVRLGITWLLGREYLSISWT